MSPAGPQAADRARPTLFLSYASEDRAAVLLIRDALPNFGLEVWYDESDLLGGDAWDQKIRRQIHDCDFFMPVISAHTEARREGYFRREWRLAAERTLDMADDSVFLVPVVIDDTGEAHARVPDKFRSVQWVRLPGGRPNAALEALCRRLVSGEPESPPARPAAKAPRGKRRPAPPREAVPAFPREEPGQKTRFWFQVAGWALKSIWVAFLRLPRWLRIIVSIWLAIVLLNLASSASHHDTRKPSSGQADKLAQLVRLAQSLRNSPKGASTAGEAKLLEQTATPAAASARASLLAIPFTAPSADAPAGKFAATVFAKVYGQLVIAHRGYVPLSSVPLPALDSAAAIQQGRTHHSSWVLYGGIREHSGKPALTVKIIAAADGSVLWSKSYPVATTDPARVAADVATEVPKIEGD